MKKAIGLLLTLALFAGALTGCGGKTDSSGDAANPSEKDGETVELSMWFWGSTSDQQAALSKNLVDKFNAAHPGYNMTVEYRSTVNKDMAVALSANQGPDIIYESSPSLALTYIQAEKYANLDAYAEKFGWQDKLLGCMYNSGVYKDSLYSIPMGMNIIGMVYNKAVLKENGWAVPTTTAELTAIMDQAIAKGLYGSVTGNKGWQPTNEDYTSLFLNAFAGPQTVYDALTNQTEWNSPGMVGAIATSAEWYQKGYLGSDYLSLDWADSAALLAEGRAPFYFGPLKFIQNLMGYAVDDMADNFGFACFPAAEGQEATYTVGSTGLLAINANSQYQDVCADFLNLLISNDFVQEMAKDWPGYWAVPLTTLGEMDMSQFSGLSKTFMEGVSDACTAVDAGKFGYYNSSYMPAEAFDLMCVVDSVWLGEKTADAFMQEIDTAFQKDYDAGNVPICPAPGK